MIHYLGEPIDSKKGIVWTNGCFDILHVGHIRMLKFCSSLCKKMGCNLIVGIDSDDRVRLMKGKFRPINHEKVRAEMLLCVKGVHGVYIYDDGEELEQLIIRHSPNVVVVGEEYKSKGVIGSNYAKEVKYFKKVEGYSTTRIVMGDGNANNENE